LKTKHTKEVLIKHPSPNPEAESKTKMSKLFEPFSVRATQDKYDKACLLKFIANAESFSSLGNQGNVLFHKMMFPDLIQPNKNLIKTGAVNLWNIVKPKLDEYISTHASDPNDITSTLDIWSDDVNQSFLGVTIHFLTKSWVLESFSIALKPIFESHTSENIASWLTNVYAQWKINPWLRINDGASNMSDALSKSLEKLFQSTCYLRCGAHKLHGVCKDLLNQDYLAPLIANHMKINHHISRSVLTTDKLANAQSEKITKKKIAKFSPTRFADAGRVFTRQYELSTEIWLIWEEMVLNMTMKKENIPTRPSASDWNNILGLSYILSVFKGSITLIEGELYPTSPWLLDAVSCVHALCRDGGKMLHIIVKNDHDVDLSNNSKIKKSCQYVVEKIEEDFLNVWSDEKATELELLPVLAATLSPSNCSLASFSNTIKTNARKFLKKCLAEMEMEEEHMIVETIDKPQQIKPVETLDVMERLRLEMTKEPKEKKSTKPVKKKDELTKYFDLVEEDAKMNTLLFWKLYEEQFPRLSKLARKYLAVPITSCPSERLFKIAKKTKTDRELLNNEDFEIQTILGKNLKAFLRLNFI
jgi:hypothetical protein